MDQNRRPSTSAGIPAATSAPSTSKNEPASSRGHRSRREEHEATKKKEWRLSNLIVRREPPTTSPRLALITDTYARSLVLTKPEVVGPLFSYYTLQEVRKILKGRMVLFIGDSVTRSVYKDLVHMCQASSLVYPFDLQKKGELRHEGDLLVKGSKLLGRAASKGIDFEEVRAYIPQPNPEFSTLLSFAFTTKMYNLNTKDTLENGYFSPQSKFGFPEIVFMNSCLWDMVRYRKYRDFKHFEPDYKSDVRKFIKLFLSLSEKRSYLIFLSTLPVGQYVSAAFLDDPKTAWGGQAQGTLWKYIKDSNKVVRDVVRTFRKEGHPVGYLDLYTLAENLDLKKQWLENDGTHWKPQAHRLFSYNILSLVAKLMKTKIPPKLEFEPYLNACDDLTRFDICVKWEITDFLRKSCMTMEQMVDMWEAQKNGATYVPPPPTLDVLGSRDVNMLNAPAIPPFSSLQKMEVDSPRDSPKTLSAVSTPAYVELEDGEVGDALSADPLPRTPNDTSEMSAGAEAETLWHKQQGTNTTLMAVENTMNETCQRTPEKDQDEPMDTFPVSPVNIQQGKVGSPDTEKAQEDSLPVADDTDNMWVAAFSPVETKAEKLAQNLPKNEKVSEQSPEIISKDAEENVKKFLPKEAPTYNVPSPKVSQSKPGGIEISSIKQTSQDKPVSALPVRTSVSVPKPGSQKTANQPTSAKPVDQAKPIRPSEPVKKPEAPKPLLPAVKAEHPLSWLPEAKRKSTLGQKPISVGLDKPKKPSEPLPSLGQVKLSSSATGAVPDAPKNTKPAVPPEARKKPVEVPAKSGMDKPAAVKEALPTARKTPPPSFCFAAKPEPVKTAEQVATPVPVTSVPSVKAVSEPKSRDSEAESRDSQKDHKDSCKPSSSGSKNGSRPRSRSRDRSERRRDRSRSRHRDRDRRRDDSRDRKRRDDSRDHDRSSSSRRREDSTERRKDSSDRYKSRAEPRPPAEPPKVRAPPPPADGPPPRRAQPPPPAPPPRYDNQSRSRGGFTNHFRAGSPSRSFFPPNQPNQQLTQGRPNQPVVFNQVEDIEDVEMEDVGAARVNYRDQAHFQQDLQYEGTRKPVYFDGDGVIETANNVQEEDLDGSFVEEMDDEMIAQQCDPLYGAHSGAPAPFRNVFLQNFSPQSAYSQDNFYPQQQATQSPVYNNVQNRYAQSYPVQQPPAQFAPRGFGGGVAGKLYDEYSRQEAPQNWNIPRTDGYQSPVVQNPRGSHSRPNSSDRRQGLFSLPPGEDLLELAPVFSPPPRQGLLEEIPRNHLTNLRAAAVAEDPYYQPQFPPQQPYEQVPQLYTPTVRLRGLQPQQPQPNLQAYGDRQLNQQPRDPFYDQNSYRSGANKGVPHRPHNTWVDDSWRL
ncbi:hypothetical protein RvY_00506 [Ramazzottius varieornatus]|uniref:Uncharacterized protein n=1 Tax=Ramazzottius varieornatus TaxID=947166 RepID=A0A1D1UD03_RAMVA|nr:hypothetical protein RvY_00506 [Ramazzottius varieornatus]